MPLSAVGVIAYAGGLLLGFAGLVALPALAAVLAVVWSVQTQRPLAAALGLLLCGGAFVARATEQTDAACRHALAQRSSIRVLLLAPAEPGAFVRAGAVECHAAVSLAVERGSASAGFVVTVVGAVAPSARGLLIEHAVLRDPRAGAALVRWRAAAGRRVDSLFGTDAPLARALLVADRRGIPVEMRDRYAAAGLAHMLSISGLHVALIAVAVDLAFQLLRLSRRRANAATMVVIGGYVALLGAPPPALRAAVMLGVWTLARWWQRPTPPWAVLAIGAAIPLVDPRAVTAVGYQLSVAGVAALVGAAHLARRWRWMAGRRGVARAVATTALASTMATVVTAPLVAWNFGRLSLIGPLTNVFAAPIMALAQPVMFLALVLSPARPVARWLADAAHPLLRAFDFVASAASSVPAALGVVFAAALVTACVSRFPRGALSVAVGALALIAWSPFVPAGSGRTELHMIDVGQGDAFALRTARGHWVLVDAGPAWRTGDAGRSTVVPYIAHRGGRLVAFVLSNPGTDHAGGAASVIRALRPRVYYDPGATRGSAAYRASLLEARRDGVIWHRARRGDSLVVDEATLTVLGPDSAWASGGHGARESSLIVRVRVGAVRFLLVGDAGRAEQAWLLAHERDAIGAEVLKVDNHGSAPGPSPAFVAAVSPRVALVSAGAAGRYGQPAPSVMRRLAEAGAQVMRTDRQSSVVVSTDGRSLRVEADGDDWPVPVRPSPTPPAHAPAPWPR